MTRWARSHRVFFVEEPIDSEGPARLDVHIRQQGVQVLVPRFPRSTAPPDATVLQSQLLRRFFNRNHISDYLLWYYTPMAVEFTRDMTPRASSTTVWTNCRRSPELPRKCRSGKRSCSAARNWSSQVDPRSTSTSGTATRTCTLSRAASTSRTSRGPACARPTPQISGAFRTPRPENAAMYQQYQQLAEATEGVHFVGRLATYRYYNMDQVVAQALATYARMVGAPRRELLGV